jgi:hypothetical protein
MTHTYTDLMQMSLKRALALNLLLAIKTGVFGAICFFVGVILTCWLYHVTFGVPF